MPSLTRSTKSAEISYGASGQLRNFLWRGIGFSNSLFYILDTGSLGICMLMYLRINSI